MSISIDLASKKVLIKIKGIDKALLKNLRRGLYNVGAILRSTASKNILKRGRQGKVYRINGRRHVASEAGESWANVSGKARRGLLFKVRGSKELLFGNDVPYVGFLEDGTRKMKARPAHLIAIKQNNKNIIAIINSAVKKTLV